MNTAPIFKVKICGLTRREDVRLAVEAGADAIGFVFVPTSQRKISPDEARAAVEGLASGVLKVGVFMDRPPAEIRETMDRAGLDLAQLHGAETPAECLALGRPFIRALRIESPDDLAKIPEFLSVPGCKAVLIDRPRGSGTIGEELARSATRIEPNRIILAGGLTPQNVARAILTSGARAVDVASGIEVQGSGGPEPERPVKDPKALREFLGAAVAALAIQGPDDDGKFGKFGGRFAPETLMAPLEELEAAYREASRDPGFEAAYLKLLKDFVGRPTALTRVDRLSASVNGARIYLKREDLAHTGAHKINNAVGQLLLAQRMGKKKVIAETGAGQHGVATAAAAARFGLPCRVYMGAVDMERQRPNVLRMRLLGAEVVAVETGNRTLRDAVSEALRDWTANVRDTYYVLGSALGPHPYPELVRDFQTVIGREARRQILEAEGRLPDELIACVGGGSNAIGLFHPFLGDFSVKMVGVEAGGAGIATGRHAARFQGGAPGVLQGCRTFLLQDAEGQILETESISAGLDYAAVGPEHAKLREEGRTTYTSATDTEALSAFRELCRLEGILPALESSHAVAYALRRARELGPGGLLLVNLSGRGDKDLGLIPEGAESK